MDFSEILELQIGNYQALQSIYGEELRVENGMDLNDLLSASPSALISEISLSIQIVISSTHILELGVKLPLHGSDLDPQLSLKQPPWMDRTSYDEIYVALPSGPDAVFEAIELILETVQLPSDPVPPTAIVSLIAAPAKLARTWLRLISLSTKSKRDDLVNWAPTYNLTGFVMAGKPGLVCLEGAATDADLYMAEIKRVSWADIPSFQKKISVVLVEDIDRRTFADMQEITSLFTMGGHRGNRPDMKEVLAWFTSNGVEHAFSLVFMSKE